MRHRRQRQCAGSSLERVSLPDTDALRGPFERVPSRVASRQARLSWDGDEGHPPRRAPSSSFPTARPGSTPPARSGRSSPSRRCSSRPTGCRRTCGCRSRTAPALQILTTRDTQDPDALAVLRHSAAHLLAEAVRRLHPGRQGRDRAADRERLLLRLRLPDPDQRRRPRGDRGRGEPRARRGALVGARGDLGRRGARAVRGRGRAVQGRARRHRRGRRSRSTRKATSPTSAAARTCRTRRRSRRSSSPRSPAPTGAATRTTRS